MLLWALSRAEPRALYLGPVILNNCKANGRHGVYWGPKLDSIWSKRARQWWGCKGLRTRMWVGKLSWKWNFQSLMIIPSPLCIPGQGFLSFFFPPFFLPASARCRTKGNEWFSYCSNAESLEVSQSEQAPLYGPACLGPQWLCFQSPQWGSMLDAWLLSKRDERLLLM